MVNTIFLLESPPSSENYFLSCLDRLKIALYFHLCFQTFVNVVRACNLGRIESFKRFKQSPINFQFLGNHCSTLEYKGRLYRTKNLGH